MMKRQSVILIFFTSIILLISIMIRERMIFEKEQKQIDTLIESTLFSEGGGSCEMRFEISAGVRGKIKNNAILLYPTEEGKVYLPSFADLRYIKVFFPDDEVQQVYYCLPDQTEEFIEVSNGDCINVADLHNENKSMKEYTINFVIKGIEATKSYEYTFYQGTTNSMFLTSGYGMEWIHESKKNWDDRAQMLLIDSVGQIQYDAPLLELKGRGNTTWEQFEKKPYQIKLEEEDKTGYSRNLFGMGKHKGWDLLALWQDAGYMATATAFELARRVGLEETSKMEYVDLYLDGEYRGVYALTERVKPDEDGLDFQNLEEIYQNKGVEVGGTAEIKEEDNVFLVENGIYDYRYQEFDLPEEVDDSSGYLIELDANWYIRESSWFLTRQMAPISFMYPKNVNQEQIQYVSALFQELEDAIYSETGYNDKGNNLWEYADIASWLKYFCIQELMMNGDAYHSSTYFYIIVPEGEEKPKIYAGPLWDMDHSDMQMYLQSFTYDESSMYNKKYIAPALYTNSFFMEKIPEEFAYIYGSLNELLKDKGWFEIKSKEISGSVQMDYMRWNNPNALDKARNNLKNNLMIHAEWLMQHPQFGAYNLE